MVLAKLFFDELLDELPTEKYFLGLTNRLEVYENSYSNTYKSKIKKIYLKYQKLYNLEKNKKTIDNLLLKYELDDFKSLDKFKVIEKLPFSKNNEHNTKLDLLPITSFHNSILFFVEFMTVFYKINDTTDIENLNKIYVQYTKETFDDYTKLMKIGIENNVVLSKKICKIVIEQIESLIKNKEYIIKVDNKYINNKFYKEYLNKTIPDYEDKLNNFLKFIKKDYLKHCNNKIGYLHLPEGKEIYKTLVNSTLTTNKYTPEYIHNFGINEVNKINKELILIKNKLGHKDKTLIEFNDYMKNSNEFLYKNSKELINDYISIKKIINKEVINKKFKNNVKEDYDIKMVPKQFEKSSALASYFPLTFHTSKNKRKGIFYLNGEIMSDHKKYYTMTLSLHEGSPGHHFQHAYPMMYKIPLYRNYMGQNTCFTEGWGLYSETLIDYSDKPLQLYGHLIFKMMRATRLVIDTGINYYGWTYNKSFKYMKKNVPITDNDINREIDRYISLPTQAISYYMGMQIFLEEFKKYNKKNNQNSTNDNYKNYHHICLKNGSIPMKILKDLIRNTNHH